MGKSPNTAPGQAVGRKLSVASFGFDKTTLAQMCLNEREQRHFLARFIGVVTGLKPYRIKEGERAGETAYGLQGQFEGVSRDGEALIGSVLYLPGYVNDAVVATFSSSDDISRVSIAFDVYVQFDDTAGNSYVFSANDLLNAGSEAVSEVKTLIQSLPMPPRQLAIAGE